MPATSQRTKMADIRTPPQRRLVHLLTTLLVALSCTCQGRQVVVDLTHDFGENTPFWPGNPALNFSNLLTVPNGNILFVTNWYSSPEHLGTHLDAPAHFFPGKSHVIDIPLSRLIGPGVVIDVSKQVAENIDYQVTVEDVTTWEALNGRIPQGAIVVMNSNWSQRWPNPDLIYGAVNATTATMHFPSFGEPVARWLTLNRNVSVVGVDTPSLDYGRTPPHRPVHQTFLGAGIPLAENLANLHLLPPAGSTIYLPVYKLVNGSGGPIRAFATYDDETLSSSSSSESVSSSMVAISLLAGLAVASVLS